MTGRPAQTRRVAVIGAGITGLAAAYRLTELAEESPISIEVSVFESASNVGGTIETVERDGFLVERGADSFITNKPWAVNLCDRLGIADELISTQAAHRRALVLRNGQPHPAPDGFMLMSPSKIRPILTSPLLSPIGKLRLLAERFVPRRRAEIDDEPLAEFVNRRFGREALERLIQPLVGGIYTADPAKLSLKATLPRFLDMEREHGSLIRACRGPSQQRDAGTGARYGLFATPRNGFRSLTDALRKRIGASGELNFGERVTALDYESEIGSSKAWKVQTDTQSTTRFDGIVCTLPAFRAADLASRFSPELSSLLKQIDYASSAVVATAHRLSDFRHPLNASGLVIPAIEQRRILAVSFASQKFAGRAPDDHVLLRTFVGGAMQPEVLNNSDDELCRIVEDELREVVGLNTKPIFQIVTRYNRAMPQYHLGHLDRVAAIEAAAERLPGFELAGNAYRGVGIPDCVHSGESAAERLIEQLART